MRRALASVACLLLALFFWIVSSIWAIELVISSAGDPTIVSIGAMFLLANAATMAGLGALHFGSSSSHTKE